MEYREFMEQVKRDLPEQLFRDIGESCGNHNAGR